MGGSARGLIYDRFDLNRRGIAFRPAKQGCSCTHKRVPVRDDWDAMSSFVMRLPSAVVAQRRAA
jgi:hypothetical protein